MGERNLIACGMYAFYPSLQQAWRDLFDQFTWPGGSRQKHGIELCFDGVDSVEPGQLLFGHTCGYPLMTQLRHSFTPFCVPLFDVAGCDGTKYSSRIIVAAGSGIGSLLDCRDGIVAINGPASNSGMNVLRYELARLGASGSFFDTVLVSGSHLASLEAVASGRARVAAIDCVSYRMIEDHDAALATSVDTIAFSTQSCGLPLVMANEMASPENGTSLLHALLRACEKMPRQSREVLHLSGFAAVEFDDYRSILEMENHAISAGYAELK